MNATPANSLRKRALGGIVLRIAGTILVLGLLFHFLPVRQVGAALRLVPLHLWALVVVGYLASHVVASHEVAVDGESCGFGIKRGAGGALLFRGIVQRAVAAFDCWRRYCAGGIGDADGEEQSGDFVWKFSGPDSGFSGAGAADGGWGGIGSGKLERGEPAFVFCFGSGGFGIGDCRVACDRAFAGAAIFVSHAAKVGAIERGAAGDG